MRSHALNESTHVLYAPVSHPFVERLIGTIRREYLDRTFFWNAVDLERKLDEFRDYYNVQRVHRSLDGITQAKRGGAPSSAPCEVVQHRPLEALHRHRQRALHRVQRVQIAPTGELQERA